MFVDIIVAERYDMKKRNGLRLLSIVALIAITNIRLQDKRDMDLIYIDSIWIYSTEVTNGMYAECVNSGIVWAANAVRRQIHTFGMLPT